LPAGEPDGRRALGRRGEDAACDFLSRQGFTIVERNWRSRAGEIDAIAVKGGLMVFVEVKSRKSMAFGEPEESVTPRKAGRIRRLAGEYLSSHRCQAEVRFDVISVMMDARGEPVGLRHIPDAF